MVELGLLVPYFSKLPVELSVLQHPVLSLGVPVLDVSCMQLMVMSALQQPGLPLTVFVLHQPVLQPECLDMSILLQPMLPLDISVLQLLVVPLDVSVLQQPMLPLDVSVLKHTLLSVCVCSTVL
jgi:hypothetical protein